MKLAEQAKYLGLSLSWEIIRCAWEGQDGVPRLVAASEVRRFALGEIETASTVDLESIAVLTSEDNGDEIRVQLSKLAPEISDRAVRVCRLLHVHRVLDRLPGDPVDALMELTSLWASLGFPADSPHVVQGRGNAITPAEYFTDENLRIILERHAAWVESEAASLRG